MASTIVGLFDNRDEAKRVQEDLVRAGFNDDRIALFAQPAGQAGAIPQETHHEPGFWDSIKEVFGMETPREEVEYYEEGARRGGTVVSVDAPDDKIDRAVEIMQAHHPVDINQRAEEWKRAGWHVSTTDRDLELERQQLAAEQERAARSEESIPVVEEEVAIGKRVIDRGGVRIHRRVTEKPVEENVQLRQERVEVERRAADRPLTAAEAEQAFKEKTIEARERSEEAVVEKKARVVEEVKLKKDVEQKTEGVRETVRRSDVDVEKLPGEKTEGRIERDLPGEEGRGGEE